jgi:hypothetical protein
MFGVLLSRSAQFSASLPTGFSIRRQRGATLRRVSLADPGDAAADGAASSDVNLAHAVFDQ